MGAMTRPIPYRALLSALIAVLLAGCAGSQGDLPSCRIGPDDGPPPLADRGIGGTGIIPGEVKTADRGIGGTGIVGVVTGFASICVNGYEIVYPPDAPTEIGGLPAQPGQLRAGQIVTLTAQGDGRILATDRISADYLLIGPVEAKDPAIRRLTIAGQVVTLSPDARGQIAPAVGTWVAVSGFMAPPVDGKADLVATRLDPAAGGRVVVTGLVTAARDGRPMVGQLNVASSTALPVGSAVVIAGTLSADRLDSANWHAVPALPFATGVGTVSLGGVIVADHGKLRVGPTLTLDASPELLATYATPKLGVISAVRQPTGVLKAAGGRTGGVTGRARADAISGPGSTGGAAGTGTQGDTLSSATPSTPNAQRTTTTGTQSASGSAAAGDAATSTDGQSSSSTGSRSSRANGHGRGGANARSNSGISGR